MTLYKYLPSNRVDVLSKLRIRYTQFGAFNDPFELNSNIDQIPEHTNLSELFKKDFGTFIEDVYEKHHEVHPLMSKADFTRFILQNENVFQPIVVNTVNSIIELLPGIIKEQFDSNFGALSLSEKPDDQLMWSHYADSHSGYVIGFNSEHEYFDQKIGPDDELRHLRQVVYKDERPRINMRNANGVDVFLVKPQQWKYEAEWRMMRPFADASEKIENGIYPIFLFDFPASCITNVILGCRTNQTDKKEIREILNSASKYSHIKLFQAKLNNESFTINLVKA